MAATLSASRNPVGLWDASLPGTTTISWNTDGNFNGQVFVQASNDLTPRIFAGGTAGARTGTQNMAVTFGFVYTLTLRRVSNNALLATLVVTVVDLQERLLDQAVAALELRNRFDPPQSIRRLQIHPAVDMVRVSFTTGRPCIPLVEIETLDGHVLTRWWPLLAGLQIRHVAVLGGSDPLPQGTKLRMRITATGRPSSLSGGKAKDVVRTSEFTTGTRAVDVSFDTLKVRTDGDPGIKGAGDFVFRFVAGDAGESFDFFAPKLEQNISAGDAPVVLDRGVALPPGVRQVYLRVTGTDRDFAIPAPGTGFSGVGTFGSRKTGTGWLSEPLSDEAWVADIVDVSNTHIGFNTIPFTLNTGNFGVAFTVHGRIMAIVRPGMGVFERQAEFGAMASAAVLAVPGFFGAIGRGKTGPGMMVALADDASVCVKPIGADKDDPRSEGWQRLAPSPGGPLTALIDTACSPLLLGLDADGEAVMWRNHGGEGTWTRLGARFSGPLAAAVTREGRLAVWGVDTDGVVQHRMVDPGNLEAAQWRAVGDEVAGGLTASPVEDGVALFALDRQGMMIHALYLEGDTGLSWRRIGGPRAGWFGAAEAPDEAGGWVVSALTEDRVLHVLHWRDYPNGDPQTGWKDRGPVDEVLPLRPTPQPDICAPKSA